MGGCGGSQYEASEYKVWDETGERSGRGGGVETYCLVRDHGEYCRGNGMGAGAMRKGKQGKEGRQGWRGGDSYEDTG